MAAIEITGFISSYHEEIVRIGLLENAEQKTVRVNISSRGGDFVAALAIYNVLRESRKRVITSAQGFAGSAAALILLAGDEIHASANAVIMFHMPELSSSEAMSADTMRAIADNMQAAEESIVKMLTQRTSKTPEEITTFLKDELWMTPEKAKEMGIIDKILPFRRRKVSVDASMPAEITNFVNKQNQEIEKMSLKTICDKFDIQVEDSATEDQLTNSIVDFIEKSKTPPTPPPAPPAATVPAASGDDSIAKIKAKLPATLVNMVKRSRKTEIDGLVNAGKITVAVGTSLEATYCDETRITNAVNDEGDIVDTFDATIDALKKNEAVVNFGGGSGVQQLPKTVPDSENLLIRDAESRGKSD